MPFTFRPAQSDSRNKNEVRSTIPTPGCAAMLEPAP